MRRMLLAPMCAVFYATHLPELLRGKEAKGGDVEFVRRLSPSLGAHSLLSGARVRSTSCANLLHYRNCGGPEIAASFCSHI